MGQPEEEFVPREPLSLNERDPEASEPDAFEQAIVVGPTEEEVEVHRGMEVSDWDAIEQAQVVNIDDEDDYR
ncbi:MAG TPA: hypothetical protein VF174_11560 [Micromonosporaceae bacterium]